MNGLWIDKQIMLLKRTPNEAQLLAYVCYRAAMTGGVCEDSNPDISEVVNIHSKTVSKLIGELEDSKLLSVVIDRHRANYRAITPIRELLLPYTQNADRYKQKTDPPYPRITPTYPQNAYTPYPRIAYTLSANHVYPIRNSLLPYPQNADSHYKDRKLFKNFIENSLKKGGESKPENSGSQNKADPPPTPGSGGPPPPPRNRYDELFEFRSRSEKLNVPFSKWFTLYQYNVSEDASRRHWIDLTDEERERAMIHTPEWVLKNPNKRFRGYPNNYLLDKRFNDQEITDRRENNAKHDAPQSANPSRDVIRTVYTKQSFGGNKKGAGTG